MAKRSLSTKLKVGANAVVGLKSISGINLSAETIDATTLESDGGYREFIGGFKDGGEVSVSGNFEPSDTNGQIALYNAFEAGDPIAFSILFPSAMGAEWTFNGVVTGFSTGAELEGLVSFDATIKVSGQPSLGLSASADLTTLATSAGTLAPTFAATTYSYYVDATDKTSFTVTATLTTAEEIKLYVDGAYVEDLDSGVASAAIAIAGVGTIKKVTVIYKEAAKTRKMYEIIAHKTA